MKYKLKAMLNPKKIATCVILYLVASALKGAWMYRDLNKERWLELYDFQSYIHVLTINWSGAVSIIVLYIVTMFLQRDYSKVIAEKIN